MPKPSDRSIAKIAEARLRMGEGTALQRGELGFYPNFLCQVPLPASAVHGNEYQRRSGPYHMSLVAPSNRGVPYGVRPRRMIAYIVTEAIKRKKLGQDSRTIFLGKNLTDFISRLSGGVGPISGGTNGNIVETRRQYYSLVASSFVYTKMEPGKQARDLKPMPFKIAAAIDDDIIHSANGPRLIGPDDQELFASRMILDETFHTFILKAGAVPYDQAVLARLSGCLAIDLYMWATHTAFLMRQGRRKALEITWESLASQFSGDAYGRVRDFKPKFRKAVMEVRAMYPFEFSENSDGLTVKFTLSDPHVQVAVPATITGYTQRTPQGKLFLPAPAAPETPEQRKHLAKRVQLIEAWRKADTAPIETRNHAEIARLRDLVKLHDLHPPLST